MRGRVKSTDFSQLFKSSQSELYSEKFYEAMNIGSEDLDIYNQICNDITVNYREKEGMKLICRKYLRFLETSKSWGERVSGYDVSLLLNYWLYDKLTQIYRDTRSHLIYAGFSALQLIWSKFNPSRTEEEYYKKCKPKLDMVDHTDWKKRKELYDYCINYDLISPTCSFFEDQCLKYCEYIEKIKESGIYDHFENICSRGNDNCPHFYSRCEKYNPKTVLNTLKCPERVKAQEKYTRGAGDMHQLQQQVEAPASAQGTEATNETSEIGVKVTNSVLGAAPVLLTATALYRYTPLGPWIRRFGGGRTNSMGAIDMVPTYMQETGDIFSDHEANYISYQPM
ncbi:PIR protein [Plasmodium vivax]|uniref:VIR protein n=1 Tax=Plasmodium vivax TaxID=5855 RepID=A0A565A4R0_PLAVI|nr:PIR protein [Plasmodium vivax]